MPDELGFESRITPKLSGLSYRYTTGYQDLWFRFANFASGAISKVYSDNGADAGPAVGGPEITLLRRQMPSN
jgi:hypothetical protein